MPTEQNDTHHKKDEIATTQENNETRDSKDGKIQTIVHSANDLSLGISIVVAVLLGLGFGYVLYKIFGYYWLIWIGLGYGVAAAILNVVKAYKRLYKDLDSLKHDEKYKYIQDRIIEKRELEAKQRQEQQNKP